MGEKKHDDPALVTASHHEVLTSILGSKDEALKSIVYSYKHGFSGFAARLTEFQAEELKKHPGVASVMPNKHLKVHTTRSWDFLGVNYYRPSGLLSKAKYGKDVIVGVVDTGIWPESRSFDDTGYGPVPKWWKGICQIGQAFNATTCNRKIIGARWYVDELDNKEDVGKADYLSARDINGHGTHVASTIAGMPVQNVSHGGLATGVARGGAPRARIAVYKVAWTNDSLGSHAGVVAAVDDAIHDGVDVLSLSLGLGVEVHGTLHAVARGITVVFSAGNDGPVRQTVGNASPWVITVAASTIDRSFPTVITLGNGEKLVGQSLYYDSTMLDSIRMVKDATFTPSCNIKDLESVNITGKVVLCSSRSAIANYTLVNAYIDAINNVADGGGIGVIYAQYTLNILEYLKGLPIVLVDYEIAYRIASYASSTRPVVKISQTVSVVGDGVLSPSVAAFSSRGPSTAFSAVLKPDIAAPGVSILAAEGNSYDFKSGTSMSCPHVSAVAALLKSVHPEWSPAIIKSAIVTTASVTDRFGMPIQAEGVTRKLADPFDFGGGHIDPDRAADPGLVYDIDPKEYTKFFNCTLGPRDDCSSYKGKLYNLNLPSIAVPDLKKSVTVLRTVTNVGPVRVTYRAKIEAPAGVAMSVEPSVLKFNKGCRSVTFKVTFTAKQWVQGSHTFGSLTWLDGRGHSVRIPIAVRTVIQDFVADVA
ncbi:hypothetical protein EJB05_27482 [Eragrostis curvula]|uniref:Inhibitor I9 domain-containing protein n=1 Tax=Eragrostis curvula TaxID=38414 RepID=A0A5J9UNS7_9POAL|nr:hypothetical protein EJB05_27482 [Eragrostis curvula]